MIVDSDRWYTTGPKLFLPNIISKETCDATADCKEDWGGTVHLAVKKAWFTLLVMFKSLQTGKWLIIFPLNPIKPPFSDGFPIQHGGSFHSKMWLFFAEGKSQKIPWNHYSKLQTTVFSDGFNGTWPTTTPGTSAIWSWNQDLNHGNHGNSDSPWTLQGKSRVIQQVDVGNLSLWPLQFDLADLPLTSSNCFMNFLSLFSIHQKERIPPLECQKPTRTDYEMKKTMKQNKPFECWIPSYDRWSS